MSLLLEALTDCVMLTPLRTSDGEGGFTTVWTESGEFEAAITLDNSTEARKAEKAGVTNLYTVTTQRVFPLKFHDVFRRVADGKIFRVTSDGADKKTPTSASLSMSQVSAEEWELK